jgi:branched-chain amino acid transport system ATP-binding protein
MLAVRDLAVHFGGVAALGGVSFDIAPNTITALIGPNGAGKTTAFNAITGYLRPSRGRVTFADAPLTGLRPSEVARRGVVRTFQRTSVFPVAARDCGTSSPAAGASGGRSSRCGTTPTKSSPSSG